ncbi:MoaD/ThiS family protein [Ideonella dechloratans]|uniref:MoaD/ThiS family protein n=1 Tax=Ideonella dechloratans TaxID=36863 RepID=UPI0028737224|nr:MoaD/ThiS family protein [Ideonella dechloratans]
MAQVRALLAAEGEAAAAALAPARPVRAAVNQVLASGEAVLADGDELAFFPPVTGG